MRRMIMAAGLAALVSGQACAQQNVSEAKEFDKPAPLTLRTRIPLPGVYGRIDHYGWDSTVETTAGAASSRGRRVRRSARSAASLSIAVQPIGRGHNR